MKTEQVASANSPASLLGEPRTGKELIAKTIHQNSNREDQRMINANCAALPAMRVKNELFGREKEAYTGALTREIGRFEPAHNSTPFLDEVGELPLGLQVKLLRVLDDGQFERFGSSRIRHADVRLIAATSCDLQEAIRTGIFREDLFYRLNVFPIHIPPLRSRKKTSPCSRGTSC